MAEPLGSPRDQVQTINLIAIKAQSRQAGTNHPNSSGALLRSLSIIVLPALTRISPEHIAGVTGTDQVNLRPAGVNPHSPGAGGNRTGDPLC